MSKEVQVELMLLPMVVATGLAVRAVRAFVAPVVRTKRCFSTTTTMNLTPVTLLSGFLGAGKTTLLQQLLKTAQDTDLKIGVVVNDVASVNVDSKLVRSPFEDLTKEGKSEEKGFDFVELGDGCICCSISDELFTTLSQLVAVSRYKGFQYDHIVIEASGVAEPRAIRDSFQDAQMAEMPLMDEIQLDTLVTVVDAAGFLAEYSETQPISRRPDLAATENDAASFIMAQFDGTLRRSVVDLLLEQVETADVVLLNKADLVHDYDIDRLNAIVTSLNTKASVLSCVHGDAGLSDVLGAGKARGAAVAGPVDEHKIAVDAVTHDHRGSHSHAHQEEDTSAGHSHGGSHSHAHQEEDHSHGSHSHGHQEAEEVTSSHSHGHSHAHEEEDSGHSHSHSHEDGYSATTARERFGIDSFVYARRRPFSPERLERILNSLPADVTGAFTTKSTAGTTDDDALADALQRLVRSKGFMWLANSHDAAYYWSHAGRFFQAPILGRWWATLARDYWPPDQIESIASDFAGDDGDRRQEIVFIGVDAVKHRRPIEDALDACLLTDDELSVYRQADENLRSQSFPSNFAAPATTSSRSR